MAAFKAARMPLRFFLLASRMSTVPWLQSAQMAVYQAKRDASVL